MLFATPTRGLVLDLFLAAVPFLTTFLAFLAVLAAFLVALTFLTESAFFFDAVFFRVFFLLTDRLLKVTIL